MQFNDLKKLCEEHNKLLEKSEVIVKTKKENCWFKVMTPRGEFYIDEKEIELLTNYYEERGLEIEKIIYNLCNK
ncbi:hypothetical protein FC831_13785 [Clostridium botulinum]|nr:hypothetical protein [Clostridium botulinum]